MGPREISSGAKNSAISKPTTIEYHHQRRPKRARRSSARKIRLKAVDHVRPASGVR
jgi:hypothetical protein